MASAMSSGSAALVGGEDVLRGVVVPGAELGADLRRVDDGDADAVGPHAARQRLWRTRGPTTWWRRTPGCLGGVLAGHAGEDDEDAVRLPEVGTDSRAVKNSPSQLTSIIWRKASVSISSTDPSRARPALATTVSRRLNSAAAASTRSATYFVVGDVCGVDEDVDPVLLTQRVGQRLSRSSRRAEMATSAPRLASACAVARPIPGTCPGDQGARLRQSTHTRGEGLWWFNPHRRRMR